jgi:hypothetical protein
MKWSDGCEVAVASAAASRKRTAEFAGGRGSCREERVPRFQSEGYIEKGRSSAEK